MSHCELDSVDSVAELRWIGLKWTHSTFHVTAATPVTRWLAREEEDYRRHELPQKHCPFLTTIGQEMYHLELGSKEYPETEPFLFERGSTRH